MTIRDHFPELLDWKLELFGTDLSQEIVEKAREARYSQFEVNRGLPAVDLVKNFVQKDGAWELKPEIKEMVSFRQMNLIHPWNGIPRCDIIFLRNVLIYFSQETKKELLRRARRTLPDDGYLFLGAAETTLNLSTEFERSPYERCGCYRPASDA